MQITRSLAYADGTRRTLDVYRPKTGSGPKSLPVVAFFYGGSWQGGSKAIYRYVGAALARRGIVAVLPDYRIYPQVRYPAFVEDGALALRWVKDNIARFGGDPDRLFVMGHSAGAYIAAMLALDADRLRAVELTPGANIAGLIGVSGPYDFLPLKDGSTLKTIFGGNDPATQPISYVAPGAPPALLLTGQRDSMVKPGNSERLAARLRADGNRVAVIVYPWVGHMGIVAALAPPPLRYLAPVLRDVTGFVASTPAPAR